MAAGHCWEEPGSVLCPVPAEVRAHGWDPPSLLLPRLNSPALPGKAVGTRFPEPSCCHLGAHRALPVGFDCPGQVQFQLGFSFPHLIPACRTRSVFLPGYPSLLLILCGNSSFVELLFHAFSPFAFGIVP